MVFQCRNSYLDHRALAAFWAISARLDLLSELALAAPPFRPPNRPKATAAGFFGGSCAVDCWTMLKAFWFKSLLERLGMAQL